MIRQRRALKNIKYLIEKYKKEDKLTKLAALEKKEPKIFWQQLKKILKNQTTTNQITPKAWTDYFDNLLNPKTKSDSATHNTFSDYVKTSLPLLEHLSSEERGNNMLNMPVEYKVIQDAIITLKNNKAAGKDMILNEMVKEAGPDFLQ